MLRLFIVTICGCFLVLGCEKPADPTPKPTPPKKVAPEKAAPEKAAPEKAEPEKAAPEKAEPADDPRQKLLAEEYDLYTDNLISHSVAELPDGEKKMVRNLLTAARLIENLHMLQLHPKNLEWREKIFREGTDLDKKLFLRYQAPWCGDNESPECVALEGVPPKEFGAVHWPEKMTDEEYESMSKAINAKELMSPFTVVRRKEGGGFDAVPYARSEIFGAPMKQVAAFLRDASEVAPHPSLKKFLASRAAAFESEEAFPYDASDYDWIALEGDWEVTVGPYETYKNPRQLKASFEMYLGREDKEITAELARFKANLQEMENALGELVGAEIYKSRKLDPRIAIRAVEIWYASGDGRSPTGAVAAFHLPNRGKSVDEGLYKKVMMINHSKAFEPVYKKRAELVLDTNLVGYFDSRADVTNVTFHEFSHGFGAYHEMKVTNPKGKTVTVKQALKEHDSLLEELKADVFGLWLIDYQKKQGWLDEEGAKKRYVSGLMHIVGLMQYPLKGTYPLMTSIQFGWYLDQGALSWNADEGRFTIDFAKLPAAIEALAKKVATIQLTGDYEQAVALVDTYITKKGEKDYALKGVVGEARTVMVGKFKEAGVKSPSLRYQVTGF